MQRQRGELVLIGDALSGMGGPTKTIRAASPKAQHHLGYTHETEKIVR